MSLLVLSILNILRAYYNKSIAIELKTFALIPSALNNSLAQVDLDKLVKKKRFKRKSDDLQQAFQQYVKQTNQSDGDTTVTIGDIVTWWADLTHQDKAEFMSRIHPKMTALVAEHGDAILKQNLQNDQTEAAFKFGQDLLLILLAATPPDKKDALVEQMKEVILNVVLCQISTCLMKSSAWLQDC